MSDQIEARLRIISEAAQGSFDNAILIKSRGFLRTTLSDYLFPEGAVMFDDEVISVHVRLEEAARRIAIAITLLIRLRQAGLSDGEIYHAHIVEHKHKAMKKLHANAKEMVAILRNTDGFPREITSITNSANVYHKTESGRVKSLGSIESLGDRLEKLVSAIAKLSAPAAGRTSAKRGKSPARQQVIHALTDAWCELSGRPPGKIKRRKTGECYGAFFEFMKAGIKLTGRSFDVEDAIKEANKYYRGKLV